jgi:hypothetical protein
MQLAALAQTDARRPVDRPKPAGGLVQKFQTPLFVPSSVEELIRHAPFIFDVSVTTVKPTRLTRASDVGSAETDATLKITSVLKGPDFLVGATILLSQAGGQYENVRVIPQDDEPVAKGERYILFLLPDGRPNLPDYGGLRRFCIDGIWHGKVAVISGKVVGHQHTVPALHAYDGKDVDTFSKYIREVARGQ